jgi:hypothetical protein
MAALIPVPPSLTLPDSDSVVLAIVGFALLGALLVWIGIDSWRNR